MWEYQNAAIRLDILSAGSSWKQDPEGKKVLRNHGSSAIHLWNKNKPEQELILCSSCDLANLSDDKGEYGLKAHARLLVASEGGLKSEHLEWVRGEVQAVVPLADVNQVLQQYTSGGFNFKPTAEDSKSIGTRWEGSKAELPSVIVIKPLGKLPRRGKKCEQLATADISKVHLEVQCSPFVLVNPAVFMAYTVRGNASYLGYTANFGRPQTKASVIFSDIRFLEGMEGGVVTDTHGKLIGMVVGCLSKAGGEGTLTVIVPWQELMDTLEKKDDKYKLRMSKTVSVESPMTPASFNGVCAITVSLAGGRRGWGSGVLINRTTVVTNQHVPGDDYQSVTVWFDKTHNSEAFVDQAPLPGVDLVFLTLRTPAPPIFFPSRLSKTPAYRGQPVESYGFGLMYPTAPLRPIQPLYSRGHIASAVKMSLEGKPSKDNAMLCSTAHCWNGSSGGGVFDSRTGELVGIMASNGKVDNGVIVPDMAFVIPACGVIDKALQLKQKGKQGKVADRVKDLWALRETHESLFNPAKPKL
ncbi:trypsin-like cysteine/serine peptidase domain-containing protein [Yarrowia lipolytica]|uniref:Serine protease n=1 Tax=Yarrowia lipolytica TaxID=4952 RepID=A0A371CB50_YARLL|nr:trypsin-like cysteine/serine peptidase domain-containing protein [Yarrowia lipolytica]RDW34399.1 trypsin-like cysteine/serine peptidase domain-containing protein [Yarrowia lipolytica]RDW42170.1 trypsin-like cysteine/serine peptidase domain-containing protein [Yarrowia lipolytica]RDW45126.1 trypsin-like cysteine/serine peptidase domain-containing protein [Yarrowia lipolytica]RDW55797.1 trypsin-like cysteine/serine peptidase domain-containing protein [Yarrowia lipolytica]